MQLSTADWLNRLFAAIDRMDAKAFSTFLADDVEFVFGNQPSILGREQATAAVDGFFVTLAGLRHRLIAHWQVDQVLVCRGEVTYTRKDGRQLTVPFANIITLADRLAREYRIYADVSPLYNA